MKNKYISYYLLSIFVGILLYGVIGLGIFDNNRILVKTLATTGPDFGVVIGKTKLKILTSNFEDEIDCGGVMLTDNSHKSISSFLDWKIFSNGDYILLEQEIVGLKKVILIFFTL